MNNRGDIEFALRLRTDLEQGQRELQGLAQSVENVGAAATTSSAQLAQVGESADQQAARIRAMVEASLQQQAAANGMADSIQRSATATQDATGAWQQNAAAQNEAINSYHNAERAAGLKAQADLKAAEAAKVAAASVEKESQELQQLLGKIDPVIRKLDELDDMEQKLRQARASGQIDLDTFDTFNAKLQEQRVRLGGSNDALRAGAITAGQYQQAMRQLPMQITDITTSLASGMPIWLVAIQQGGQIKDSFGGIGNAGRALVSVLNPLTLAIGASTVALGATAFAYYQGSQEAADFREQLILSGNAAGTSSDQLMNMAASMDLVRGTQRQAAAALAEVAGSGKIASDQIMLVASAAVAMQDTTGRAVSETVAEFVKIANDPVKAVAELNREYNFLSAAVYEQIAALAEQGDETEAARLAMEELAQTMESRATQIEGNLGLLESAWKRIKGAAAEAWDEMVGVGREQSFEEQLAALDRRSITDVDAGSVAANAAILGPLGAAKELWDQLSPVIQGATEEGAKQLDQDRTRLQLAIQQRDTEAAWQGEMRRINQDSIEAQQAIAKVREQGLSKVEQKERAIAEYRANVEKIRSANPDSAVISDAQIDKDITAIEKRYAERKRKAPVDREARAQENYLAQLERQASTLNMTSAEVRQYELAEKGLTGAMLDRAQAALVLLDADEQQRQAAVAARTNAGLEAEFLRAAGRETDAALLEIRTKFDGMRSEFEKAGNEAGLAWLDKLIPVAEAKVRVDDVQREMERILAEQQRQEQSVNVQQDAGLITELQARERILDIHRKTYEQLLQIRPVLADLAQQPGAVGEAAAQALAALDVQAQQLNATTTLLQETLRDGLTSGFTEALTGLANGTMTLREAVSALGQSVLDAMTQMAAENLAQSLTSGVMGMFGAGGGQADMTSGAAAVTGSAAALSTAGGSLLTGAAAIQAAATTLAAANGVSGASSVAGAATSGAANSSWLSSAASWAGSFFAEGGHVRGPGTGTSDSIPAWLSDYEFVTRAAVVTQPGALPFLNDFNARGMAALDDWSYRVRHNTGGLAGVPAPALPAPGMQGGRMAEPAASMSATLKNSQTFNLIDSPERIADVLNSPAGDQAFTVMLSRDPAKFRTILGL
ncbi:phage tail length tape measure family protein [uncultured Pseudomonas sp.]|uniref:phage tail length tape measure family protein n=1 Tax=uncultured Pseudomonas sp. TaxID=114707 RepID=UPI0030D8431E|tara:strand:+ start:45130 stop:48510 length:3381 start_codon:yes stop_codon:yes gene_type:complete